MPKIDKEIRPFPRTAADWAGGKVPRDEENVQLPSGLWSLPHQQWAVDEQGFQA